MEYYAFICVIYSEATMNMGKKITYFLFIAVTIIIAMSFYVYADDSNVYTPEDPWFIPATSFDPNTTDSPSSAEQAVAHAQALLNAQANNPAAVEAVEFEDGVSIEPGQVYVDGEYTWTSGTFSEYHRGVTNGEFIRHVVEEDAGLDFTISGTSGAGQDTFFTYPSDFPSADQYLAYCLMINYDNDSIHGDNVIGDPDQGLSGVFEESTHSRWGSYSSFIWTSGEIVFKCGYVSTIVNGSLYASFTNPRLDFDFTCTGISDETGYIRFDKGSLQFLSEVCII